MGEGESRLQRIGLAEWVPGVHHGVVSETDVDPGGEQLLDAGVPAADWVVVEAALEDRIVQRVGHHVQPGPANIDDQAAGVGVVVGVHRGRVAGSHPPLHVEADRLGGQHLEEPRVFVVGFVAMHVHLLVELVGQGHRELDRLLAVLAS